MKTRLALLPLFAYVFLAWLLFPPDRADANPSSVASIKGESGTIFVQHGASSRTPVSLYDSLYVGDTVSAGPSSFAVIQFDDGSEYKLDSGAKILIGSRSPSGGGGKVNVIFALLGTIWSHVRPNQRVAIPPGNIAARGTDFVVNVDPDGTTEVAVVTGSVTLTSGGKSVDVPQSFQSTAQVGVPPTSPTPADISGLIAWTTNIVALPMTFETPTLKSIEDELNGRRDRGTLLNSLLSAAPSTAAEWSALGDARRIAGDTNGAISAYKAATLLGPDSAEAYDGIALTELSEGGPDSAKEAKSALIPVASQPEPLAISGLIDMESGDFDSARLEFNQAIEINPGIYPADSLLALISLQDGDLPLAEQYARKAAAIAPRSSQAQGTLSIVLFFENRPREAAAASRIAVTIDPDSPFALLTAGRSALEEDHFEAARTSYERALTFAPNLWLVHEELGEVYEQLQNPYKSAEEFRIAVQLDPGDAVAYAGLGQAYQDIGDYQKADQAFSEAMLLSPHNELVIYDYASYLIERGKLDQALAQLTNEAQEEPKFGLLYSRIAEIYLYKQNLFAAQNNAVKAVNLLPNSALAHYELGRIEYEEQHSYQAEQEFRMATILNPGLATAKYALGLVEEKTQSDPLANLSSVFDSAYIGSPASSINLNDLDTPGADERVQAAVEQPTSIRSASRSYGDTEVDTVAGSGNYDAAVSNLSDIPKSQSIVGVSGSTNYASGIRQNADTTLDTGHLLAGKDSTTSTPGFVLLGDFEQTDQGLDNRVVEDPGATSERFHVQLSRATVGFKVNTAGSGNIMFLFQGGNQLQGTRTGLQNSDPNFEGTNHFDTDSLDGEIRWDVDPEAKNRINIGLSYGDRRRRIDSVVPVFGGFPTYYKLAPFQMYMRDDVKVTDRLTLTSQVQAVQDFPTTHADLVGIDERSGTTKLLPYELVQYSLSPKTLVRFRYQQLFYSVDDFQLLNPTDEFLIDYSELPQATFPFNSPIAGGTSVEAEIDSIGRRGAFFSAGLFRQDLQGVDVSQAPQLGPYDTARVQGVQLSYQGLLSSDLSYFLLGEFDNAEGRFAYYQNFDVVSPEQRVQLIPNFTGLGALQYISRRGWYGQLEYYWQGDRLSEAADGSYLDPFGVVDVRVGKRIGLRYNVFVELNNAFDQQYDEFNVDQPTEELRAGATIRL
jgi:tetratricopeptide (TPR) repeat protein